MAKRKTSLISVLKEGIISKNPVFIQLLGMCPTLATSTSLSNAFGMGLAATFVLIGSNLVISVLRKYIPSKIRIASYIVIIAGFVTCIDMLIKAYVPALSKSLGLFIPLIVVNCIILGRAEAYASKNAPLPSVVDGIGMGLGFTLALTVMSFFRELLGSGTLFGHTVLWQGYRPMLTIIMPAGGFLTLGLIIAAVQYLTMEKKPRAKKEKGTVKVAAEGGAE